MKRANLLRKLNSINIEIGRLMELNIAEEYNKKQC